MNRPRISPSGSTFLRFSWIAAMIWLTSISSALAEPQPPVQVFDVQQEQVVATLPNTAAFREQAASWLKAVQHLSGRARVEAESGIVVHIPLQPPLPVQHNWLTMNAADLYLFIDPEKKKTLICLYSAARASRTYLIVRATRNPF